MVRKSEIWREFERERGDSAGIEGRSTAIIPLPINCKGIYIYIDIDIPDIDIPI